MRTVEMAHEKASAELEDSLRQLTGSEKLRIERLEAANTGIDISRRTNRNRKH